MYLVFTCMPDDCDMGPIKRNRMTNMHTGVFGYFGYKGVRVLLHCMTVLKYLVALIGYEACVPHHSMTALMYLQFPG